MRNYQAGSAILFFAVFVHDVLAANMNGKPGQYKIANGDPSSKVTYSTDYKAEHFDVYSQTIKSRYSEVYWRMQDAVPIPQNIQERFANTMMAIVGYEVNQVRTTASGQEESVPITWAYNHHYVAWLLNSKKAKLVKSASHFDKYRGVYHGAHEQWVPKSLDRRGKTTSKVEDSMLHLEDFAEDKYAQLFSEGNGGEFRMSYHGYPRGYAQLIEGPDSFQIMPMQIDTWNRTSTSSKFTPGLIECPCSDRLPKAWGPAYALAGSDSCRGPVPSAPACFEAARQVLQAQRYAQHAAPDPAALPGCSVLQHENGAVEVYWNSASEEKGEARREVEEAEGWRANGDGEARVVGFAAGEANVTVSLSRREGPAAARITLAGPGDRWFGVGFGASSMCVHMDGDECVVGGPYAIVVHGDGQEGVTERRLDYHGPGRELRASVTVTENTVRNGIRTVVLTRMLKGATEQHFSFDPSSKDPTPVIMARGCGRAFAQHCGHGASEVTLVAAEEAVQLCSAGTRGSIGGSPFLSQGRCWAFPQSDLLDQRNPTCDVRCVTAALHSGAPRVRSYRGGMACCRDGQPLLDRGQEYRLKFRFYFEEFRAAPKASHLDLVRLYWMTEAWANEYDIPACARGVPAAQCVHVITARWKVREMLSLEWVRIDPARVSGVALVYAGPHCHAPSCAGMELYNADTGRLLCSATPEYGGGGGLLDEEGYLAIPPCLCGGGPWLCVGGRWEAVAVGERAGSDGALRRGSAAEGLSAPEVLSLDTTLLSVKRNNNSLPHTGEMASWQMRGVAVWKQQPGGESFGWESASGLGGSWAHSEVLSPPPTEQQR